MKLAIMQPYFFPYIGYFQLMKAVDDFVVYDNIEYTRKGWINRNRILVNGKDAYITLPLRNDSDYKDIKERHLAESWSVERKKMINRIAESYRKAPFFKSTAPLVEKIILHPDLNLFNFLFHSLISIKEHLEIQTRIIVSSTIDIDHTLKREQKVFALCGAQKATTYLNPIGGTELYTKDEFKGRGIELQFLKTNDITYQQYGNSFTPSLSIIDVMMFNSPDDIAEMFKLYTLN